MIEIREAGFTYPGASSPALADVELTIAPAERVAVLGRNGSGKSTLARLLNGLLQPSVGSVTVDGIDTRDAGRLWEVRTRVAMVFQNPDNQIVGTTVEEDVAFGPENLGVPREEIRRRVDESLAAVGLAELSRREPHQLSQGQKQRVAMAGALAMRPDYIVLDEPTAMLDPCSRDEVLAVVADLHASGRSVVHVTHDLADAAAASRAVVLDSGRVAYDGDPGGLLGDADLLSRCGLELAPIAALGAALRRAGVDVPGSALDAESVVAALWP